MNPTLIFEVNNTEESNKCLNIILDKKGLSDDDIRVKWAQLAIGYANELIDSVTIEYSSHIKDLGATIEFTSGYDEDEDEDNSDSEPVMDENMAIGFTLDTNCAHEVIGGFTTPSVVVSHKLMSILKTVRQQVVIPM